MRRRQKSNSIISSFLKNGASADHRKSTDTCTSSAGGRVVFPPPQFDLPGIHISRIETIDYDDSSVFSGSGQIGTTRFIVIHSDGSSDFSRLSFPNSECSLSAGSRSSRSRSSKDSSNVSSRLWDFSPRESDWDVNVPLSGGGGGGGGGGGSHRNELPGGARDYSMLSPSMPRKGSVVTFDISEPTVRRHSSPASSVRRKDSINMVAGECPCCRSDYPPVQGAKDERSAAAATAVYRKKSSGDQSLMSITIDENDGDEDDDDDECDAETCPLNPYDASTTAPAVAASDQPSIPERSGFHPAAAAAAPGGRQQQQQQSAAPHPPPPPRSCGRPSLRRHNTDDSEIERRMAKVFHEINYSLTDSLEETKYQSPEGVAEAETQTMSEQEIEALLKDFGGGGGGKRSDEKLAQSDRADGAAARSDPAAEFINSSETSGHSRGEREGDPGRPTVEKRSKLSLLTAALFPGRNRKSSTKGEEGKRPPNRRRGVLLMLGLTE